MPILAGRRVSKVYGAQQIFAQLGFQIEPGARIGLIGPNGTGKSTLLNLISGAEPPTTGSIDRARGLRLARLTQEVQFPHGATLASEATSSMGELAAIELAMQDLELRLANDAAPGWSADLARYGELQERFELGGGYEQAHQIKRVFAGLGFIEATWQQPLAQFSGGQKTRAALALALLSNPDLLVLDEPTNHLDLTALRWLEEFLQSWSGTLLVVSHDRYFLDQVTNQTWELEWGTLRAYAAPYSRYLELKAEQRERQLKVYTTQQEFVAKTEAFIRRYKNGHRASQAAGREKRLKRFKHGWDTIHGFVKESVDPPRQRQALAFALETSLRSGETVLKINRLEIGYQSPDTPQRLISLPDLQISRGERIALLGANGSGKSSLLRTLVGLQPALSGGWEIGSNVQIGYYAQGHEALNLQATILEEVLQVDPLLGETRVRTLLGRFLFTRDDVTKRIRNLSGGERSRVALAKLMIGGGNFLLLDEPTNHLDMLAREALEVVLQDFNGTILLVSHDRYFISEIATDFWTIEQGVVQPGASSYLQSTSPPARRGALSQRS